MIKEAYVSYEVAKLLKKKGFDAQCRAAYTNYGKLFTIQIQQYVTNVLCSKGYLWDCIAPTHQMAMKWLREKHIVIIPEVKTFFADGSVSSWEYHIWCDDNYEEGQNSFSSYEEAVEAACLYVLNNLI